jgi:hypothetical protein
MLVFPQEGRLWLCSAECLVDAYVLLLKKFAHAQMVVLAAFCLACALKCRRNQFLCVNKCNVYMYARYVSC